MFRLGMVGTKTKARRWKSQRLAYIMENITPTLS